MASSGPPVVEHLLSRARRTVITFAARPFRRLFADCPDTERPPDDLVLPDDEDEEEEVGVVGADDVDELQEAEAEPRGGDGEPQFPPPHFVMERQPQGSVPLPVYYLVPYPVPYAVPYAVPYPFAAPAFPHADPYDDAFNAALERIVDMYRYGLPEEEEEPEIDVVGLEEEDEDFELAVEVPVLDVEDIGPLCLEDSSEELADAVNPGSPSTSGLGSSARRRREESDEEEAAAKRPRWSEESDED